MAIVYVVGCGWLVAADATSSFYEWCRALTYAIKYLFDVGVDDFGDDVNNRSSGFTIAS